MAKRLPYIETLDEHMWLPSAPGDLSSVNCQCTLLYPFRNQNFTPQPPTGKMLKFVTAYLWALALGKVSLQERRGIGVPSNQC